MTTNTEIKTWQERIVGDMRTFAVDAAKNAEIAELRAALEAKSKRAKFLETLADAYGPKSYAYDVEHPNDGLNAAVPVAQPVGAVVADGLKIAALLDGLKVAKESFMRIHGAERIGYAQEIARSSALQVETAINHVIALATQPAKPVDVGGVVEPKGDALRKIVRSAATSCSDEPSGQEYVIAGWRAALAAQTAAPGVKGYGLAVAEKVRAAFISGLDRRGYLRAGTPLFEHGQAIRDMMDLFDLQAVVAAPQPVDATAGIHWAIVEGAMERATKARPVQGNMAPQPVDGAAGVNEDLPPLTMSLFANRADLEAERKRRVALAERIPMPYAYDIRDINGDGCLRLAKDVDPRRLIAVTVTPLYTAAPASAAPVDLSDETIHDAAISCRLYRSMTPDDATCEKMVRSFVRALLAVSGKGAA